MPTPCASFVCLKLGRQRREGMAVFEAGAMLRAVCVVGAARLAVFSACANTCPYTLCPLLLLCVALGCWVCVGTCAPSRVAHTHPAATTGQSVAHHIPTN
jgi:hypothetical protein